MNFTPVNGTYSGPPVLAAGLGGEAVKYRCRSQRVLISVVTTGSAPTTCLRPDGSTYELELVGVQPYEHPVLDARATSVAPLTGGQFTLLIQTRIQGAGVPGIPIQVTGSFSDKRTGTMRMSHPECNWLNREGPINLVD
jgi:hypothetical protein